MLRFLSPLAAITSVVISGAVHGLWTERWVSSDEPAASAARMETVPFDLPDWDAQTVPTNRRLLDGVAGCLYRHYKHRRTGTEVTLFMVCGKPGPVSVHTPDVCYGASGFTVLSQQQYSPASDRDRPIAQFNTAQFRKKQSTDQATLRIFWAWAGTDGSWIVPEDPRRTFANQPALYKLYLIRDLQSAEETLETDPCNSLIDQLLPTLRKSLFTPS